MKLLLFWISAIKTESSLVQVFWDFLRNKFLWFENIVSFIVSPLLKGSNMYISMYADSQTEPYLSKIS